MNDDLRRITGWPGIQTPEFALVVAATAWPFNESRASAVRDHSRRTKDWDRVLAIVERHRVAGLAMYGLAEAKIALPAAFRAQLSRRATEDAIRELSSAAEMARLCRLLLVSEIDVLALKGATVALAAYGRFGVRSSIDIDLLVHKNDVARAERMLELVGYVRTEPAARATAREVRARLARYKDFVFENPRTGHVVELHWRLFTNPVLTRIDPWSSPRRLTLLEDQIVSIMSDDNFILYQCAHGAEHAWMRLRWLAEIAALLDKAEGAADRLYELGRSHGLHRLVGPGLVLSHLLFGSALPARLLTDLRGDWRMASLVRSSWVALAGSEDGAELDQQSLGTARKNLSHYLFSFQPLFWFHELSFDLRDKGGDRGMLAAGLTRLKRLSQIVRQRSADS